MCASDSKHSNKTLAEISCAIAALAEKKAEDIRVLDVSVQSSITDYLVLATGTSDPHLKALKGALDQALKRSGVALIGEDRELGGGWILVDAQRFLSVHLQTGGMRELYRLEQLWSDAKRIRTLVAVGVPVASARLSIRAGGFLL